MQNINPNSLIKTLLQKKIEIHELEQEIEGLKDSLSQVDPFLLVEIQTKLSNGKDLQNRVAEFIDNTSTNLTADNLLVASDSLQEAAKLKIDFPELKQLEILTKISAWLTKVYIALKPTTSEEMDIEPNTNPNTVDVNETIHQIQNLINSLEDATQIEGKTKWKLKPIIAEIKFVDFKDSRLAKITQELVQIIWAKEGLDLLKKDKFSREELSLIKDELKPNTRFQDIYQKINQIYTEQKNWSDETTTIFEQKQQTAIENSIKSLSISQEMLTTKGEAKSKQSETQIQTNLNLIQNLLKQYNDRELNKIQDFDLTLNKLRNLEKQLMWVQESYQVIKASLYGSGASDSFTFKTLQTIYDQAMERKISQDWPIFQEIQKKYQNVAKLLQAYNLYEQNRKKFSMKMQQELEATQINVGKFEFYEHNKLKSEYCQIVELIAEMKESQAVTTIDMRNEIQQLSEDKDLADALVQQFEEFKHHYSQYIMHYSEEGQQNQRIDESLFEVIREELNKLKSSLLQTPLYLTAQETFLYQFELNFETLNLILNTNSLKSADIKEWRGHYELIQKSGEESQKKINQFIRNEISREINTYDKVLQFVTEIRKFNAAGNNNNKIKANERGQLQTSNQLGEIYTLISQCKIAMKSEAELIDTIMNKVQKIENTFNTLMKYSDRKPITEFSNLLEAIRKLPIRLADEEKKLTEILDTAETLISKLKTCQTNQTEEPQQQAAVENMNIYDLIQQYQEQRVWLIEYEKLVKNFNQNEENLKVLEEQIVGINEMNIEQICQLGNKLDEIPDNFQVKRLYQVRKEIYLKKIRVFKDAWEDTTGFITYTISLRGVKDRLSEGKMLAQLYNELELKQAIFLLEEVIRKVQDKLNQVKRVKDLEKLTLLENDPSEMRLKCIDFAEEFIEHKLILEYEKMYKDQPQQPQQTSGGINLSNLPSNPQPNILGANNTNISSSINTTVAATRGTSVSNKRASTYTSRRSASVVRLLGKRKQRTAKKGMNTDDELSEEEWNQKLVQEVERSKTFGVYIFNKTNVVKQLQAIIELNKYWKLSEVEQMQYAIKVADFIEKKIMDLNEKQQQNYVKSVCSLMKRLKSYNNLSNMILNVEFSQNMLVAFLSKNDKQLEILNKKPVSLDEEAQQVSKKNMSQRDDFVIKKKKQKRGTDFGNTAVIATTTGAHATGGAQQQQSSKPEGKRSVIPQEFLEGGDSDSEYYYDETQLIQQSFQNLSKQMMTADIQKLIQERTLLQRFRMENGTLQQRKLFETAENNEEGGITAEGLGAGEGEFSDDEGQNMFKDFEPLKEDEVEQFQRFLTKQGTGETFGFLQQQQGTGKILFDPEQDEFRADTQQKLNQGLVPLKGSTLKIFEGSIKYSQNRGINLQINLLTLEPYTKMSTFPDYQTETNKNSFSITKKLHIDAFQSYFEKLQVKQNDKKNNKRKVLATGWLEPSCLSKLEQFEEISEELRRNDQTLLIKWSPCCKLFVLHSEQIQMSWNKFLKFKQKPVMKALGDDINLIFVMIFKQYKMTFNQLKIRPIVIHGIFEETKKPTEHFVSIEATAESKPQQQQQQQPQPQKKMLRRQKPNQNLLAELMNPGKFATNIQAFSKEISLQQKSLSRYQRQQGQAMKSRLIKESLNQMMNEKSVFQKQEQLKQMRQSVDRKSVDVRRHSVDRKSMDRKSMMKSVDRKSVDRRSTLNKRQSVDRKSVNRKSVDRRSILKADGSKFDAFKLRSNSKRISKSKSRHNNRRSKSKSMHNGAGRGESKFKSMQSLKVNKLYEQVDKDDCLFAAQAENLGQPALDMMNYEDVLPQTIFEDVQMEQQQYPEIDILSGQNIQKKRSSSRNRRSKSKSMHNNDKRRSKSKSMRRSKSKSKSKKRSSVHKRNFLDEPLAMMKQSVPVDISGNEFDQIYSQYNTDFQPNNDNNNNDLNFNQDEFEMLDNNVEIYDQPKPKITTTSQNNNNNKKQTSGGASSQQENQQVKTLTTLMETINKSLSQFLKSNEQSQQSQQQQQIQSQQYNSNANNFGGNFQSKTQMSQQNNQNRKSIGRNIFPKNNNNSNMQQFNSNSMPESQDLFEFSASQPNFNNQNVQQQFKRSVSKRNNNNNNIFNNTNMGGNQNTNSMGNNNLNGIWKRSQSYQRGQSNSRGGNDGTEQPRFNSKSRQRSSQSRQRSSSHARQGNFQNQNGNNNQNNNNMRGGNFNFNNNKQNNFRNGQNNFNQGGRGFSRDKSQFKNNNNLNNNNNQFKFENKENFNKFQNGNNNMKRYNNYNNNGSMGRNSVNNRQQFQNQNNAY